MVFDEKNSGFSNARFHINDIESGQRKNLFSALWHLHKNFMQQI